MDILFPAGQHLFSGKTSLLKQLDLEAYVKEKNLVASRIVQCHFWNVNEKDYQIVDLYRPNTDFRLAAMKYDWVACSIQKM